MPADKVREDISQIVEEKEQFVKYACNKKELSVRAFKKYINEQYQSDEIDLTNLPPLRELRKRDPKELVSLWKRASGKLDQLNEMALKYTKSIETLETVLAEKVKMPK
jgi:hypothetical protein